jgi:hypothetical protein
LFILTIVRENPFILTLPLQERKRTRIRCHCEPEHSEGVAIPSRIPTEIPTSLMLLAMTSQLISSRSTSGKMGMNSVRACSRWDVGKERILRMQTRLFEILLRRSENARFY